MVKTGKVLKTINEYAVISMPRETACGEQCKGCISCDISNIELKVFNEVNAKVDDFVEISFPDDAPLLLAFYVFIVPIIIVFGGFLFVKVLFGVIIGVVFSIMCIIGWIFLLYQKNKYYSKKTPDGRIITIVRKN